VDVEQSEIYEQVVEVVLENMAVRVEIAQHAAGVDMILDGKVDCVRLVCHTADAILNVSQAVAKFVPEMKMGGGLKAGESDDSGD